MAGLLNIPKFVDFRNKVKRHPTLKFPVLSLNGKTTIAIHHSLTKQGLAGSNAEGYARFHVDTNGWPSIGYSYVIEPDGTIKFCNDIELRTYHVGNHNNYAVGICLTGDFRIEKPTKAQEESLRNLVSALQKTYPHLKYVKGHNEFSGYEWKACPVFDFRKVLAEKSGVLYEPKPSQTTVKENASAASALPNTYSIQQGDTLWSIAKGLKGISVEDLIKANPGIKPNQLQIGQKINLGTAVSKPAVKPAAPTPSKTNSTLPTGVIRQGASGENVRKIQAALASVYFYPDKGAKNNGVDGLWGPKTTDAIRRFQSVYVPKQVDGIYGPTTKKALEKVLKK